MTLLSILVFGFFLGMRHSTDSDHVVAVSTIVSRQQDIRSGAMTGVFWGIGHSITLLDVGGAIILFGIVIPERLGLSLEFCVALMLILTMAGLPSVRSWRRAGAVRIVPIDLVADAQNGDELLICDGVAIGKAKTEEYHVSGDPR